MPNLPTPRSSDPLERWDPFQELNRLTRELNRVFDRWPWPNLAEGAFVPAADLVETDDAFLLEVELPGIKRDDITIEVSGTRLVVRGERKEREAEGIFRRRTRVTGTFHYEVELPAAIDPDHVDARLEDGVLTVRVPKAGQDRPRRIPVR